MLSRLLCMLFIKLQRFIVIIFVFVLVFSVYTDNELDGELAYIFIL